MDEKRIDEVLEGLGKEATPAVPRNLEPNVWRRIRLAEEANESWLPLFWPRWIVSSGFVTGVIAVSLGVGLLTGTYAQSRKAEASLASNALPLGIFTNQAPMLDNPGIHLNDK